MELAHTHYEPAGAGPHPTVIALHGWGASAFDLIGLAPVLAGGRVQMVCPQGSLGVPIGDGAAGYGWFPLTAFGQVAEPGTVERAAAAVCEFVARACERYPVDPRKLVLLGFSQGGLLAYLVALREPRRFAGLVALSSWLPPALASSLAPDDDRRLLATLVQHGDRDEVINVVRARQSIESLRALGVGPTYREYEMGHEITALSLTDLSAWLEDKVLSPVIVAGR